MHPPDTPPNEITPPNELDDLQTAIRAIPPTVVHDNLDDLAGTWATLKHLSDELAVTVNDYAVAVGSALRDAGIDAKDGYELPSGRRVTWRAAITEQWAGRRLLRAISTEMIDPATGEVTHAVPLSVLADVIPGVATEDATSSRWLKTGLQNIDVDVDEFRTVTWRQPRAEIWRPR